MPERHASPGEFRKAAEGVDFPASRTAIINRARDNGGLDTELTYMLERIPERSYESMEDIEHEVDRLYAEGEGLAGGGPAAPSGQSEREKDIIERNADPRAGEERTGRSG